MRIDAFGVTAGSHDLIFLRKHNVIELGVYKSSGSHNSLICRIDETRKAARQIDVLIWGESQAILLEPDRNLVRGAPGSSQLLQTGGAGVETGNRVRPL